MKPWPSSTNRPPTIRHLRVGVGRSTRQAFPDHELQPAPRAGSGKLASSDATLRVRASSSFGRLRGISTNRQPRPEVARFPSGHSPGGCRMSGEPSITTSDAVARGHRRRETASPGRSTRNRTTRATGGATPEQSSSTTCCRRRESLEPEGRPAPGAADTAPGRCGPKTRYTRALASNGTTLRSRH